MPPYGYSRFLTSKTNLENLIFPINMVCPLVLAIWFSKIPFDSLLEAVLEPDEASEQAEEEEVKEGGEEPSENVEQQEEAENEDPPPLDGDESMHIKLTLPAAPSQMHPEP